VKLSNAMRRELHRYTLHQRGWKGERPSYYRASNAGERALLFKTALLKQSAEALVRRGLLESTEVREDSPYVPEREQNRIRVYRLTDKGWSTVVKDRGWLAFDKTGSGADTNYVLTGPDGRRLGIATAIPYISPCTCGYECQEAGECVNPDGVYRGTKGWRLFPGGDVVVDNLSMAREALLDLCLPLERGNG